MKFDIVRGKISNLQATNDLVENIKKYFGDKEVEGTLYLGYPLSANSDSKVTIDALLITKEYGIIIFIFPSDLKNSKKIMDEQDSLYFQLDYNFKKYPKLRSGRKLSFEPLIVSVFPDDNYPEVEDGFVVVNPSEIGSVLESNAGFVEEVYLKLSESLQKVTNVKPKKKRTNVTNDMSFGGKIKTIEAEIANLDQWQKKAALELPEGPQRIRGLAGSGKTIVLALKAAYLHSQYPEWKIAVTYYTRSLSQQLEDLIRQFSFEFSGEEPNWDKIDVVHAWGSAENGVYSIAARSLNLTPLNFTNAKMKYGRDNAFKGACNEVLSHFTKDYIPIYDAILIDEAQDLPSSFFRVVYNLVKSPKRITWAYDELQNLSEVAMPSLKEMFGIDADGNSNIVLERKEDEAQQDIILPICYRNPPWALSIAHALGFGLYRKQGLVQMFDELQLWEDIGYRRTSGELEYGKRVKLERKIESAPKYFKELLTPRDSLVSKAFESEESQYSWVASEIKKNIVTDELDPDDILVIFPNAINSKREYLEFRKYLLSNGIDSILAGVDTDRDIFRVPGSVSCSSIYRAKGNEAPIVYILNTDYCASGIELIKLRNTLFTSITRSRGWIRICGVGSDMELLNTEINKCIENEYSLDFSLPTFDELKEIRKINRERTQEERKKHTEAISDVKKIIEGLESGELDPELIPELNSLMRFIEKNKTSDNDEK